MNVAETAKETFIEHVDQLNESIAEWLRGQPSLRVVPGPIQIEEDLVGRYSASALTIYEDNRVLARFKPLGAFVVAAKGRVDVEGPVDRAVLLWLDNPRMNTTVTNESGRVTTQMSVPIVSGVESPGWYWLHLDRRDATPLQKASLLRLLTEVSDRDLTT